MRTKHQTQHYCSNCEAKRLHTRYVNGIHLIDIAAWFVIVFSLCILGLQSSNEFRFIFGISVVFVIIATAVRMVFSFFEAKDQWRCTLCGQETDKAIQKYISDQQRQEKRRKKKTSPQNHHANKTENPQVIREIETEESLSDFTIE